MPSDDGTTWRKRRSEAIQRDGFTCQSCGRFVGGMDSPLPTAHVHHNTPKSDGGDDSLANLTTLCQDCHDDCHPQAVLPDHSNTDAQGHTLVENPNWAGGRTCTSHGYILLKRPDHPDADTRGYVYEHRLVAANDLGRSLRDNEQVHHKNGDKTDNCRDNLEVLTLEEHRARHREDSTDLRDPGEPNPTIKCACGCGETLQKYDDWNRPRRYLPGHNRRDAPTPLMDAVLNALDGGPAELKKLEETVDREVTRSALSSALARLKDRGAVKNPRRGVWALPEQTVPGKSRQERVESDEEVKCACGCGQTFTRYDEYGREREYLPGHNEPERPSPVQDAVLRTLAKTDEPMKRSELLNVIEVTNSDKSVGAALRALDDRGEVHSPEHGYWARTS